MGQWLSRAARPAVRGREPARQIGGNVATEEVVRAPADGYTHPAGRPRECHQRDRSIQNLKFNFLRDIAPVAGITREALVMLVHPSVPAKTVRGIHRLCQGQSGRLKMASTGNGSSPHVSGELFKIMTGVEMPVVHYAGGGPALKAMIEGEAQMMFEPMSASIEPVRNGKLRPLAVTTAARSAALPDIPILADTVPGYEASAVTGIGVPKDTPAESSTCSTRRSTRPSPIPR